MNISDVSDIEKSLYKSHVSEERVQRAGDRPTCLVRQEKIEWYELRRSSYPGPHHIDVVGLEKEC